MRSSCMLLAVLLVATLFVPSTSQAQSRTVAVDPQSWSESLELGPVSGLTTQWHAAPVETGVPVREALRFRIRVPQRADVLWSGAREIERTRNHSTAEAWLDAVGRHTVSVTWTYPNGVSRTETAVLHGVDLAATPLTLSPIRVAVDEVQINPDNPNASTMKYFFRGDSIAPLVELGTDHYRTSVNRSLHLAVDVEPVELAPLIEWRLNGSAQEQLGAEVEMTVFGVREHAIAAGGDAVVSPEIRLDTYRVRITEETRDQQILDGVPVTYRAETDPPGYEDEIAWLASTKYGTCSPDTGHGPEFTTVFSETVSPDGQWLGVRAANDLQAQDGKGGSQQLFEGPVDTASFTGRLALDFTTEDDCVLGSWTLFDEADEMVRQGTLAGRFAGATFNFSLDPDAEVSLQGESVDGSLIGTILEAGTPLGDVELPPLFCAPNLPDLKVLTGGLEATPPFTVCLFSDGGLTLGIKNQGSTESPETSVGVRFDCGPGVGPGASVDLPPLAAGQTFSTVVAIPEQCLPFPQAVSISIDPFDPFDPVVDVPECNTINNSRRDSCIVISLPVP